MMPSGSPTPVGGAQSVPSSLLRSNSNLSGGNQQPFSLVSPRTQFNTNNNNGMNILGNIPNVSSLMNHPMGNGMNLQQLGSSEPDPLSFTSSQPQQFEQMHNFQQQQQLRGGLGNVGGLAPVKLEPQSIGGVKMEPQSIGGVKMEPQQLQSMRNLGPVKLEQQHSDSSIFLQQQHQQQQLMQMSRQSPQNAMQFNLLQQQRIIQHHQQQQQQQQQLLKGLPPRAQLQQQQQQQQLQQSLPMRTQLKTSNYEPGACARKLTQYMYHQQHRPEDNNIEFWRKFVTEYFAPNAKKRWCVSLYGSGRQTTGVFPQDVWHCEICNRKPGRGFETTAEVLPRLCQIKYASGTLEELLYVDMPRESHNAMGQIVLDYPKAIQESVFEQLRVVRDGHLRIVFNPDLKISSWEFCARKHEELIPRRLIVPQVSQLGAVVQKYQNATQNAPSGLSTQDLQNSCNSFVASARQLAKSLEVPLVNDLGYTKRYVRCLQISEVVNSMKDLIDYSRETRIGPMESLINFPRRSEGQNTNRNDQSSANATMNGDNSQNPNSMNSRQDNNQTADSPPTPTTSNNNISAMQQQQPAQEPDSTESQSSVQRIIQGLMMSSSSSSQLNGVGLRAAMGMNGRVGVNHMSMNQQQRQEEEDMGNRLMGGLGSVNDFNNLRFDWKTSP